MHPLTMDSRTVFVVAGILYLLMPALTWWILYQQRDRMIVLWCLGGAALGVGGVLIALRGSLPDLVSVAFANLLIFSGTLFRCQALRMEWQRPWKTRNLMLGIVASGIFFWLVTVQDWLQLRISLVSLVHACTFLLLSQFATMTVKLHSQVGRSARLIRWSYLLLALTLSLISAGIWLQSDPTPFGASYLSLMLGLVLMLVSITSHIGYVGLKLDQLSQSLLEQGAELVRQQEQLNFHQQISRLDRQRALGEMSTTLAHEIRQPVTATLFNAQTVLRSVAKGTLNEGMLKELMEQIQLNMRRTTEIIDRVANFISPSPKEFYPVNLTTVLKEVSMLLGGEAVANAVDISLPEMAESEWVMGDALQLSQVLVNVFRNAIEAMDEYSERRIVVTLEHEGVHLLLNIDDTGKGIDEANLARLGEQFFTTKSSGVGLGLSISFSIIERHGGRMSIQNCLTGGARVTILLPIMGGKA